MKHLLIKDRNLRRFLVAKDRYIFLNTFLGHSGKLKKYKTKLITRCLLTNRSRAVLSFFRHSRIIVRQHCLKGFYPGVVKSSW
jgi:ribosomal protein S14